MPLIPQMSPAMEGIKKGKRGMEEILKKRDILLALLEY